MTMLGILLMAVGLLGPAARVQWERRQWLGSARWLVEHGSVHLLKAAPIGGLLLSAIGLTLLWSGAVVLALVMGLVFIGVLFVSAGREGSAVPRRPPPPVSGSSRPGSRSGTGTPRASSSPPRRAT